MPFNLLQQSGLNSAGTSPSWSMGLDVPPAPAPFMPNSASALPSYSAGAGWPTPARTIAMPSRGKTLAKNVGLGLAGLLIGMGGGGPMVMQMLENKRREQQWADEMALRQQDFGLRQQDLELRRQQGMLPYQLVPAATEATLEQQSRLHGLPSGDTLEQIQAAAAGQKAEHEFAQTMADTVPAGEQARINAENLRANERLRHEADLAKGTRASYGQGHAVQALTALLGNNIPLPLSLQIAGRLGGDNLAGDGIFPSLKGLPKWAASAADVPEFPLEPGTELEKTKRENLLREARKRIAAGEPVDRVIKDVGAVSVPTATELANERQAAKASSSVPRLPGALYDTYGGPLVRKLFGEEFAKRHREISRGMYRGMLGPFSSESPLWQWARSQVIPEGQRF